MSVRLFSSILFFSLMSLNIQAQEKEPEKVCDGLPYHLSQTCISYCYTRCPEGNYLCEMDRVENFLTYAHIRRFYDPLMPCESVAGLDAWQRRKK